MTPPTEQRIALPHLALAALAWGDRDRPPLIALHGWLDNAASFARLAPLLAARWRVIAPDLPGHGHSDHLPPAAGGYAMADYVRAVLDAADAQGLRRFALLGHSMGAGIAALVAAAAPARVERLWAIEGLGPIGDDGARTLECFREALAAPSAGGKPLRLFRSVDQASEPVQNLQVPRAGSCLHARQGRARKWTSVHDRAMTPTCGQTDPAQRVASPWPPCGRARLGLPARQAGATPDHLAATGWQRGALGDYEQALSARAIASGPRAEQVRPIVERGLRPVEGGWQWRSDPRLTRATAVRLAESQVHALLRGIQAPTALLLARPASPYLPGAAMQARAACVPRIEVTQMDGGHHLHLEHPDAVAAWMAHAAG